MIINIFVLFIGCVLDAATKIDLVMLIMEQIGMIKKKRYWKTAIFVGTYILLSYLITSSAIKVILDFAVLVIGCYYLLRFNKKYFSQIIVISFIIWVSMLLIDIFSYVVLFNFFKIDLNIINSNVYFKVFLTSCICFFNNYIIFKGKNKKVYL